MKTCIPPPWEPAVRFALCKLDLEGFVEMGREAISHEPKSDIARLSRQRRFERTPSRPRIDLTAAAKMG